MLFIAVVFVLIYYYYNKYDKIEAQYFTKKIERYNRDDWGRWTDDDEDGLNTRNEVLLEESLIEPIISNNRIVSGRWYDKYTGKYFDDPKDLDIDHLVPLKNAYISGASNWSKEKKTDIIII